MNNDTRFSIMSRQDAEAEATRLGFGGDVAAAVQSLRFNTDETLLLTAKMSTAIGNDDQARKIYERAILYSVPKARSIFASWLELSGEFREAASLYIEISDIEDNPESLLQAAKCLMEPNVKDFKGAETLIQTALRVPGVKDVNHLWVQVLQALGRDKEAAAAYHDEGTFFQEAIIWWRLADQGEGRAERKGDDACWLAINRCLEQEANPDIEVHFLIERLQKRNDPVEPTYRLLAEKAPRFWGKVGWCRAHVGDVEGATDAMRRLKGNTPDEVFAIELISVFRMLDKTMPHELCTDSMLAKHRNAATTLICMFSDERPDLTQGRFPFANFQEASDAELDQFASYLQSNQVTRDAFIQFAERHRKETTFAAHCTPLTPLLEKTYLSVFQVPDSTMFKATKPPDTPRVEPIFIPGD